jgi:hypothetical protein
MYIYVKTNGFMSDVKGLLMIKVRFLLVVCVCAAIFASSAYGGRLQFGTAQPDGEYLLIPINLSGDNGPGVSTIDFNVRYDPAVFEPSGVSKGPSATAADKNVSVNKRSDGDYKVLIVGLNQNTMENGEIATLVLKKIDSPQASSSNLRIVNTTFAAANADPVPSQGDTETVSLDETADQQQDNQTADANQDDSANTSNTDPTDPVQQQNQDSGQPDPVGSNVSPTLSQDRSPSDSSFAQGSSQTGAGGSGAANVREATQVASNQGGAARSNLNDARAARQNISTPVERGSASSNSGASSTTTANTAKSAPTATRSNARTAGTSGSAPTGANGAGGAGGTAARTQSAATGQPVQVAQVSGAAAGGGTASTGRASTPSAAVADGGLPASSGESPTDGVTIAQDSAKASEPAADNSTLYIIVGVVAAMIVALLIVRKKLFA